MEPAARVPAEAVRAEEPVEPERQEAADGTWRPIHRADGGIREPPRQPAPLEANAARLEGVAGGRQPLQRPHEAQEGQREDHEERVAGGGDEEHRQRERHRDPQTQGEDPRQDALAGPQRGGEEQVLVPSRARSYLGWISRAPKKYGISKAADSGESDPCTALASIEAAKSFRMVPAAALAGSVAPMRSRRRRMAPSPSSTMGRHGPWVMKAQRLAKKGRALWTA